MIFVRRVYDLKWEESEASTDVPGCQACRVTPVGAKLRLQSPMRKHYGQEALKIPSGPLDFDAKIRGRRDFALMYEEIPQMGSTENAGVPGIIRQMHYERPISCPYSIQHNGDRIGDTHIHVHGWWSSKQPTSHGQD